MDDNLLTVPDDLISSDKLADIQSICYETHPLSKLDKSLATDLCKLLFSPDERFAQGFYRYWSEILKKPHEQALQDTLQELETYLANTLNNLDDPHMHTVGFNDHGKYVPVGIYGFRDLSKHAIGPKIKSVIDNLKGDHPFSGRLAIAHTYSALNGYRNLALLKYSFVLIALEAIREDFQHIFFFMSDHRLGTVYKRFGLEFPSYLAFPDSKHLIGYYTPSTHMEAVLEAAQQFGLPIPENVESYTKKHTQQTASLS